MSKEEPLTHNVTEPEIVGQHSVTRDQGFEQRKARWIELGLCTDEERRRQQQNPGVQGLQIKDPPQPTPDQSKVEEKSPSPSRAELELNEKSEEGQQQHQNGNPKDPHRGPETDGHIPAGQQENLAELDSQKLEQNVGPDIQTQAQAQKNLDAVIQQVKQEFREWKLVKRRDLVTRLGNAFERVCPSNPETVCEEIKNALRDEIAERLISTRDIERYCPDKWKKKTSPKSDKLSLSKQEKSQLIGVSIEGNQISQSDSDSKAPDTEKQQEDQSPSAGEASPAAVVDQSSYNQLKTNTESYTVDDFAPSGLSHKQTTQECSSCLELRDEVIQLREALRGISIPTADQIPTTGLGFTIPKEKYEMVIDAMERSKSAIFVECDESKKFVRAESDVYNVYNGVC